MGKKIKIVRHSNIPALKHTIQCSCGGSEFLQFLAFNRDEISIKEEEIIEVDELYVDIYGTSMGLWQRVKACYEMLVYGEYRNFGAIVSRKEIDGLIVYLNSCLKYWSDNYEE